MNEVIKHKVGKQKTAWFSPHQLDVIEELKVLMPGASQGAIIREALDLLLAAKTESK